MFRCLHLGFSTSVASGWLTGSSSEIAVIEKGGSRWNFVSISSRSWVMPGGILTPHSQRKSEK